MSPNLIILLLVFIAFAVVLYYLYVIRGWYDVNWGARAAIVISLGMMVPIITLALFQQFHAKDRLAELGIAVYPELGPSVGVSTGLEEFGHTWVFEYEGAEAALLGYYRDSAMRPGWNVISDDVGMLIMTKDERRLVIANGDGTAIFQLSDQSDQNSK